MVLVFAVLARDTLLSSGGRQPSSQPPDPSLGQYLSKHLARCWLDLQPASKNVTGFAGHLGWA